MARPKTLRPADFAVMTTAVREHGIVDALARPISSAGLTRHTRAPARPVRVPFKGPHLKRWQRRHNTTHAKIRCVGEQAMATLKGWRLLRKVRCSTNRVTGIVKAVLALPLMSA